MTDPAKPPKRSRLGGKKVRTGCLTCKIRRVKCDEARPACRRCTSTGRKCDGYAIIPKRAPKKDKTTESLSQNGPSKFIVPLPRQLFSVPDSSAERRSIEFFHAKMAPKLSGYFDGLFWNRLLLQLGQNEPAIKHAMMAISSMYERFESNAPHDRLLSTKDDSFALMSYNKAIKSLSQRLSCEEQSVHVPLVACILFICLEFLRRDIDAAMTHIHSGFAILRARTMRSSYNKLPPTQDEKSIEETMLATFTRLRILSGFFGKPAPPMKVYEGPTDELSGSPLIISTFNEARTTLHTRMAPCLIFVRVCSDARFDRAVSSEYITKQASLMTALAQWKSAFEDWFPKQKSDSKEDHLAARLLRLHHGITDIAIASCLVRNETIYDKYTDRFEEMVKYASELIVAPQVEAEEPNSRFSFEMGTIPALYFIGIKCRHPDIRRRAIRLLLNSPRREGLWDAYRTGKVAERVMLREEFGFTGGMECPLQIAHGYSMNELSVSTPQHHRVSTSRIVPILEGNREAQARSNSNLERMRAEEYEYLREDDPNSPSSLRQASISTLGSTPITQAQVYAPTTNADENVNAGPMLETRRSAQGRGVSGADTNPSPLKSRPQDMYYQDFNSSNVENFNPFLAQERMYIPPRKLPLCEPGPIPWNEEEFHIKNLTQTESEIIESQYSMYSHTWTDDQRSLLHSYIPTCDQDFLASPSSPSGTTTFPSEADDLAANTNFWSPNEENHIYDMIPQKMPSESQRIHDTRMGVEIVTPFEKAIQPVTFRWKPYGLDGGWQVWGESIQL